MLLKKNLKKKGKLINRWVSQHLMLEEFYYPIISSTTPAWDEIRPWQKRYQENEQLLSLRHTIQVRVINKTVSVSHDRGTYPAHLVTAATTMEVIQEDQLIPPGQVPSRPSSKDTQAVSLLHLLHLQVAQGPQILWLHSSSTDILILNRIVSVVLR